jgi:hypothetical protein
MIHARVIQYNRAQRTVEVVPLAQGTYTQEGQVKHWALDALTVPLMSLGTSRGLLHVPLVEGDTVMLLVHTTCSDDLRGDAVADQVAPAEDRRFDLNDAWALPVHWRRAPSAAENDHDVALISDDVMIGQVADAKSLAFKDSVNGRIDDIMTWLVGSALPAAAAGSPIPAYTGQMTVAGTSHTRAS